MFKPDAFFFGLQKRMVNSGFTFVGSHWITNEDVPYHVPVKKAKETTLVFHKREKCFVLSVSLHETHGLFDSDEYRDYWDLHLFLRFKFYADLLATVPRNALTQPEPLIFPGYNDDVDVPNFRNLGGSRSVERGGRNATYFPRYESTESLSLDQLSLILTGVYNRLEKLLDSGQFESINSHHFFNSYSFGGSSCLENPPAKEFFLERFDTNYLKQIFRRVK